MKPHPSLLLLVLLGLAAGCTHSPSAQHTSTPATMAATRDAWATQREREGYVDANYQRLMESGRFKNEAEAKAYAAYEWGRLHPNPAAEAEPQYSATWSSADAAKRQQAKLEADLTKMERAER